MKDRFAELLVSAPRQVQIRSIRRLVLYSSFWIVVFQSRRIRFVASDQFNELLSGGYLYGVQTGVPLLGHGILSNHGVSSMVSHRRYIIFCNCRCLVDDISSSVYYFAIVGVSSMISHRRYIILQGSSWLLEAATVNQQQCKYE